MPESDNRTITSLRPEWMSRGLVIRVLAYMVGAHLFAGFLFLLFEVGARHAR